MNVTGIIAEYNPLHNGHLYQLNAARQRTGADFIVVVMSGNFVQRAEPALVDKWTRAKMALLSGADLVLELPVPFATASAEFFAKHAVNLLDCTGIVNNICFGTEADNLQTLTDAASILHHEPPNYKLALKSFLNEGLSFPAARAKAFQAAIDESSDVLNTPNNILGIEYLKALKSLNSQIAPHAVQRTGSAEHDATLAGSLSSATAIRNAFFDDFSKIKSNMPPECFSLFKKCHETGNYNLGLDAYTQTINYLLRATNLSDIFGIGEGIENRIARLCDDFLPPNELIDRIKTKRYTRTKIKRLFLHLLLGLTKQQFVAFENTTPYVRILGLRRASSVLVREMSKMCAHPIIKTVYPARKQLGNDTLRLLDAEIAATNIYALGLQNTTLRTTNSDYLTPPVIV